MPPENENFDPQAQQPDPQIVLNWARHYCFNLGWVIIPIHRFMGLSHKGEEICSCEIKTGVKWKNCSGKAGKHPWGKWGGILTPQAGFDAFYKVWDENPHGVNIGIRTGKVSGIWAIDIDEGTDKSGIASLERWLTEKNLSYAADLNNTLVARTGGGGLHYIFAYPEGVDKISTVAPHEEMGPHVDIKGDGGYIIVHPAMHRSGKQYYWATPIGTNKDVLKLAPEIIITAVRKRQRGVGTISGAGYTPDLIELQEYAEELSRKKSEIQKTAGKNMLEALKGNAIADEGGGHDAYRNVMYYIAKKYKRCDPAEVLGYFEDSVKARFAHKADASTDMGNLIDSMQSALDKVIEEANTWQGQVALTDQGRVVANDANMLLYFRNHEAWQGVFGYDLRLNKPVYLKRPPLVRASEELDMSSDKSDTALWFQTRGEMTGRFAQNDMSSAILSAAKDKEFDPLVSMLEELRGKWDGHPRLKNVLQRVAGVKDTEWTRIVFRKWMISAVARIRDPGCKVDTMMILEGSQGFKKSTFFSTLIPHQRYFSDGVSKVKNDVETIRLIHSGPLIFELGELSGLRKQEVDEIKAFLSAREDHLRPLYEAPRKVLRRCVFVGSTNLDDYLRDSTGGRRFWPVEVTCVIDIATVESEREQWWAEALAAYEAGEEWWIESVEEKALAKVEQDKRFQDDAWTPAVVPWLDDRAEPRGETKTATEDMADSLAETTHKAGDYVTTLEVLQHAVKMKIEHIKAGESKRIEGILRTRGWMSGRWSLKKVGPHFSEPRGGGRTQQRAWKRPGVV